MFEIIRRSHLAGFQIYKTLALSVFAFGEVKHGFRYSKQLRIA
jgi:hypothetical protein